jgi:hypothetical protein
MPDDSTSPKYNVAIVEQVILEEAVELHPQRVTVDELSLKIVTDPDDSREVETARQAIRGLRDAGLFAYDDDDEVVEPTVPAIRAYALLVG